MPLIDHEAIVEVSKEVDVVVSKEGTIRKDVCLGRESVQNINNAYECFSRASAQGNVFEALNQFSRVLMEMGTGINFTPLVFNYAGLQVIGRLSQQLLRDVDYLKNNLERVYQNAAVPKEILSHSRLMNNTLLLTSNSYLRGWIEICNGCTVVHDQQSIIDKFYNHAKAHPIPYVVGGVVVGCVLGGAIILYAAATTAAAATAAATAATAAAEAATTAAAVATTATATTTGAVATTAATTIATNAAAVATTAAATATSAAATAASATAATTVSAATTAVTAATTAASAATTAASAATAAATVATTAAAQAAAVAASAAATAANAATTSALAATTAATYGSGTALAAGCVVGAVGGAAVIGVVVYNAEKWEKDRRNQRIYTNYVITQRATIPDYQKIQEEQSRVVAEEENNFVMMEKLKKLQENAQEFGFSCKDVPKDGNCFFHAVFMQLGKSAVDHLKRYSQQSELRKLAIRHINEHSNEYSSFVSGETIANYMEKHSKDGEWVDNLIINALSRALRINIVIIESDTETPIILKQKEPVETIYLGYQTNFHYLYLEEDREFSATRTKLIERYIAKKEVGNKEIDHIELKLKKVNQIPQAQLLQSNSGVFKNDNSTATATTTMRQQAALKLTAHNN